MAPSQPWAHATRTVERYDPQVRHDVATAIDSGTDGVIVRVWVVPRAKRSQLAGIYAGALRVRVAAPPEKGRANWAVAALLGEIVGRPVELLDGATSRRKRFLVRNAGRSEIVGSIAAAMNG